jgi:hypothetical protein
MIFFIWCLNLGISLWNAYATGKVWVEAKHAGGVHRFMAWMGYLMASLGFSWAILVLVGMLLQSLGTITPDQATLFLQAGYVLVVPGFLFSGYAIMFQSWANAYRNHSVVNMGVAAYNTYANVHNTFSAIDNFPKAFGSVFTSFSRGSGKSKANGLILFVAVLCVLSGFVIAALIVHRVAASDTQVPARADVAAKSDSKQQSLG